jgi:suppressor for copper-sensitivity B
MLSAPAVALLVALAPAPGSPAQDLFLKKASLQLEADPPAPSPGGRARLTAVVTIEPGWHTNSHRPTYDLLIPTQLDLQLPAGWKAPEITYPEGEMKAFEFTEEPISVYEGTVRITADLEVPAEAAGRQRVAAVLRYQACDDSTCLPPVKNEAEVILDLGGSSSAVGATDAASGAPAPPPEEGTAAGRLAVMMLLGVLGGLLLNVMPCVLPVLSIKVFGLVGSAGHGRRQVVAGALATSAGILASFWALALAAVGARAAGAAVGWGTQFQHPPFLAFLAVVVVLFSLNLWGLFEVPLPGAAGRLSAAGAREGLGGHFASGLFTTLMATPCSAPFLGTAVGFGLAQPAAVVHATFTAIGLGMASPYLLLAIAPGAVRLLPRPGAWMERVRQLLGFLLLAAVVWLFFILAAQVSPVRLALLQLSLLVLALFVWLRFRVAARPVSRHLAAAGMVLAVALTLTLASGARGEGRSIGRTAGLIPWVPFDRTAATALADDDKLVFVDVTADWCFTCKTNERLVLETDEVATAFERHGVVAMRADWTNPDEEIQRFLTDFGKAGIPFYVLYRPGREPHVFSELLTRASVLAAIEESRVAAATPPPALPASAEAPAAGL